MQDSQFDHLLKDVDRVKKCSMIAKSEINKSLDNVIDLLTETKQQINEPIEMEGSEARKTKIKNSLHNLHEKLKEKKPLKQIIDSHKKYFQYLSKYGKNIDKVFRSDINNVFKDTVVTFDKQMVNQFSTFVKQKCEINKYNQQQIKAIAEHFLIEKKFDLYESFMEDTGLTHKIDQEKLSSLKRIQKIFDQFQKQQLHEAIAWAESKKKELSEIDSPLLFYLHRLRFIQLKQKCLKESTQYAKKNLQQFFKLKKDADQAQKVMGYLIYNNSKFPLICDKEKLQTQIEELLLDNFCKLYSKYRNIQYIIINSYLLLLDLTMKSALLQCLIAGALALPKFLKYTQISCLDEEFRDYHTKNEYPIEVEIGKDFKFHSFFVCPISRDVIEPEQNPVLLTCGHVIAEASMKKITSNANKEKFKCPTCPKDMTAKDTKKIYF